MKANVDTSNKAIDDIGDKLEKAYEDLNKCLIKNSGMCSEAEKLKCKLEVKDAKITGLDNVCKELKLENENLKNETRQFSKSAKVKENEVAKLLVKNENLNQSLKNCKAENKILITEKNKAVKDKVK